MKSAEQFLGRLTRVEELLYMNDDLKELKDQNKEKGYRKDYRLRVTKFHQPCSAH